MAYGGTAIYTDQNGQVQVIDNPGIATQEGALLYREGADYAANEYGLYGVEEVLADIEQIIATYTASGPTRADGVTPTYTNTAVGITGSADGREYRFIQLTADAQTIAIRETSRRARAKRTIYLEAPCNPDLHPGQTIILICAKVGYESATPALVNSIDTATIDMRATLFIEPSLIDGFTTQQPPVADFSMIVEVQPIVVAGVPTTRYLVQCRDQSYDLDGTIQNREFTPSAGGSPASSTEETCVFIFSDIATATITLEAEDNEGFITTVTKPVPNGESDILTRQISLADDSVGWKILWDGAEGFTTYARAGQDCTAVPTFNEQGNLIAGWSDGVITEQDSNHELQTLATLDAQINCLFRNEGDSSQILAGHGNKLSRSLDGGTTWNLLHTFDASVNDCQSSPFAFDEIRVASGNKLFLAFDALNYTEVITGEEGSTAETIATAAWGHAVVFSGASNEDHVFETEEGQDVDWTGVVSPPSTLLSVSAFLETEGFFVGDDAGNIYSLVLDGSTYEAAFVDQSDVSGSSNDMIRDGALPSLTYIADDDGLYKMVNNDTLYQADLDLALQVGYGKLAAAVPIPTIDLVLSPWGESGADDRFHLWSAASESWSDITPPQAGWYWHLFANPNNSDEWLAIGATTSTFGFELRVGAALAGPPHTVHGDGAGGTQACLYYSSNRGSSWTPIALTIGATELGDMVFFPGFLTWSEDTAHSGKWMLLLTTYAGSNKSYLWRGTNGAISSSTTISGEILWGLAAGLNGDMISSRVDPYPSSSMVWMSDASFTRNVASGGDPPDNDLAPVIDRFPGLSRVTAVLAGPINAIQGANWDQVFGTMDYKGSQPQVHTADDARWMTVAESGVYLATDTAIKRIDDFNNLPVTTDVVTDAAGFRYIRAERLNRIAIAAMQANNFVFVAADGETWVQLPVHGSGFINLYSLELLSS